MKSIARNKHITLPAELHDRATALTERLGCSFSRLVQIALVERLPRLEFELGGFELEAEKSFEIRMMETLIERSIEKTLRGRSVS